MDWSGMLEMKSTEQKQVTNQVVGDWLLRSGPQGDVCGLQTWIQHSTVRGL